MPNCSSCCYRSQSAAAFHGFQIMIKSSLSSDLTIWKRGLYVKTQIPSKWESFSYSEGIPPCPGLFSHGKISESHRHRGMGFQTFRMRPFCMLWGTLVDIKDQLRLGFGTPCRDWLKVAALKLLQLAPLCLGLRSLWLPDRGGSLERLHRRNRYGVWLRGLQGEARFQSHPESWCLCLNMGLMKPWKGFTRVGQEKLEGAREYIWLTSPMFFSIVVLILIHSPKPSNFQTQDYTNGRDTSKCAF
jgi:hypothetical protein